MRMKFMFRASCDVCSMISVVVVVLGRLCCVVPFQMLAMHDFYKYRTILSYCFYFKHKTKQYGEIPPLSVLFKLQKSSKLGYIYRSIPPLGWYHISTVDLGVLDPTVMIHFERLFCTGVNSPMRVVFSLLILDMWRIVWHGAGLGLNHLSPLAFPKSYEFCDFPFILKISKIH